MSAPEEIEVFWMLKWTPRRYVFVYFKTMSDRVLAMTECSNSRNCSVIEAGVFTLEEAIANFVRYPGSRENDPSQLFAELLAQID